MTLRKKSWISAVADGSIDSMNVKQARKLVGFVEPGKNFKKKECWTVTMADEEAFMDCKDQESAMILADTQQILHAMWKK